METKELIITNKRLNRFAHDINNCICAAGGYIALIERKIENKDDLQQALNKLAALLKNVQIYTDELYKDINPKLS